MTDKKTWEQRVAAVAGERAEHQDLLSCPRLGFAVDNQVAHPATS
jgi:hypothetical protein